MRCLFFPAKPSGGDTPAPPPFFCSGWMFEEVSNFKVYVVRLKGATKALRFLSKECFDSFIDMLASLQGVSVSVEEIKNE